MSHQSDLPPHVPSCVSTGAGVTVPDATATPRTIEQAAQECLTNLECNNYGFAEACAIIASAMREVVERELTAAKAEIARLNSHEGDLVIGCAIVEGARRQEARAVDRLEADSAALRAEVEQLRAQLRERTQWQCKCGGTDCAGQAENQRLRAEVEAFKANNRYMRGHTAGYAEARDEYGEQLKPLFAKVRELEAVVETARAMAYGAPELNMCNYDHEQVRQLNDAMCEVFTVLDAARAGKGAT